MTTKPTKNEILDCNDEKQLREWAATVCYGWHRKLIISKHVNFYVWVDELGKPQGTCGSLTFHGRKPFNPCSPTVEGMAQCFELMVKYELAGQVSSFMELNGEGLQETIVKAAIISELEK